MVVANQVLPSHSTGWFRRKTMNRSPQVSVVMPVFNAESSIGAAISSILAQTFHDFELIIVDNGSTDDSARIITSYERDDERVKVFSQPNRGMAHALNMACGIARGSYIARMDADDISLPERLTLQANFLREHQDVALLGGAVEVIDAKGERLYDVQYPLLDEDIRLALPYRTCFAHPAVVMRRDAYLAVGGYRSVFRLAQDYDLWLRLSEHYRVANLPEIILRYRIHPKSMGLRNIEKQALGALAAKVGARARQAYGTEPFVGTDEINYLELREVGVPNREIRKAVVSAYLRWSNLMLRSQDEERGIKLLAKAFLAVGMSLPEHSGSADDAFAGSYYKWRELLLKFLIVLARSLARPGPTARALVKLARPKSVLRQSQP